MSNTAQRTSQASAGNAYWTWPLGDNDEGVSEQGEGWEEQGCDVLICLEYNDGG